ncbi:MAG: hypothetical protein V4590_13785 [Bacteroidota bacterium]
MKHKPFHITLCFCLLLVILPGCGGKIYGFRKTIRVKDPVAKAAPKTEAHPQRLEIIPSTHYTASKPVDEIKKPSVISVDNRSSSAMFR